MRKDFWLRLGLWLSFSGVYAMLAFGVLFWVAQFACGFIAHGDAPCGTVSQPMTSALLVIIYVIASLKIFRLRFSNDKNVR